MGSKFCLSKFCSSPLHVPGRGLTTAAPPRSAVALAVRSVLLIRRSVGVLARVARVVLSAPVVDSRLECHRTFNNCHLRVLTGATPFTVLPVLRLRFPRGFPLHVVVRPDFAVSRWPPLHSNLDVSTPHHLHASSHHAYVVRFLRAFGGCWR